MAALPGSENVAAAKLTPFNGNTTYGRSEGGDDVRKHWSGVSPQSGGRSVARLAGLLGLLLATIGLYAVVAYSVVKLTREIGIRLAMGASRANISRMVFREAARLTFVGLTIGLFIAFLLRGRWRILLSAVITLARKDLPFVRPQLL